MSISNKTMMTETRELTLKIIDEINRLRVESRGTGNGNITKSEIWHTRIRKVLRQQSC